MEKPREFDLYFVTDDDNTISPYDAQICENTNEWSPGCGWAKPDVHVIEKSAYDQLLADARELQRVLQKADSCLGMDLYDENPSLIKDIKQSLETFTKKYRE